MLLEKSNHHKKQFSATLLKDTNEDITLLQKKIIDFLKINGSTLIIHLQRDLNCSISPIKTLAKKNMIKIEEVKIRRNPFVIPTYFLHSHSS